MGRRKTWTKKRKKEMLFALKEWIFSYTNPENEEKCAEMVPQLTRFCAEHQVPRQRLYEWAKEDTPLGVEYTDVLNLYRDTKEAILELGGLTGKFNQGVALRALTQLGWRADSTKHEGSVQVEHRMVVKLPAKKTEEEWRQTYNQPEQLGSPNPSSGKR